MAQNNFYFRIEFEQTRWIKISRSALKKAWPTLPDSLKQKLQIIGDIWLNGKLTTSLTRKELSLLKNIGTSHGFVYQKRNKNN